jgi:hypothetical protein
MPLFDKFTLKSQKRLARNPKALAPGVRHLSTEARKLEFGIDFSHDVPLNLGGHSLVLDALSKQWQLKSTIDIIDRKESSESTETNCHSQENESEKLKIEIRRLHDENRLLKLKVGILVNLLSEIQVDEQLKY